MRTHTHTLLSPASGTQRTLHSLHYGRPGVGKKIYIQASLHADEMPGMLVAHHLRRMLNEIESKDGILGEVVLVPMANPIGLDQTVMHYQLGRFELASMHNFNRRFPDFFALLEGRLPGLLGPNAATNVRALRLAMREVLLAQTPTTELESLRQILLLLAHDADVVLDLHCDYEAILHLYVEQAYLSHSEALQAYLGAETVLFVNGAQGDSFDESLGSPWWQWRAAFAEYPVPLSCFCATVELRGQSDVAHALAEQDAQNLVYYMQYLGILAGTPPAPPAPRCWPTPLAGNAPVHAPHAGVLVFLQDVGADVQAGQAIAHIVDPVQGQVSAVCSPIAGRLYARHNVRWATRGMEIARVAGEKAYRTGNLLSP